MILPISKNRVPALVIMFLSASLFFLSSVTCRNNAAHPLSVTISDFRPAEGKWKGTLTYLDYSSNKLVTIPANTMIEVISDSVFDQYIYYTEEPDKNDKRRVTIYNNGQIVNETKLVEKKVLPGGLLKLVFENKGPDGNDSRPATFHQEMIISSHRLTITKWVKFEGEKDFFQRHQYSFSR